MVAPAPAPAPAPAFGPASTFADFARENPQQYVIDGLLPEGSLVIAAGEPKKAHKSMLTIAVCISVSHGHDFLGRRVEQARPAIYSQLEDGARRIGFRGDAFVRGGCPPLSPNLRFSSGAEGLALAEEWIRASRLHGIWVIDPLIRLARLNGFDNENDAFQMDTLLAKYQRIAQDTGWAVMLVHHFRKQRDMKRGSVALDSSSDGWWDFHFKKRSSRDGWIVKVEPVLRDGDDEGFVFEFWADGPEEAPSFHVELSALEETKKLRGPRLKSRDVVLAALTAATGKKWSAKALSDETGVHRDTVGSVLKSLQAEGLVSGVGGWSLIDSDPIDPASTWGIE